MRESSIRQPDGAHTVRVWQERRGENWLVVVQCQQCEYLSVLVNGDLYCVSKGRGRANHSWGTIFEIKKVGIVDESAAFARYLLDE